MAQHNRRALTYELMHGLYAVIRGDKPDIDAMRADVLTLAQSPSGRAQAALLAARLEVISDALLAWRGFFMGPDMEAWLANLPLNR